MTKKLFEITKNEVIFAVIMGFSGYIFNSRWFLMFLHSINQVLNLLIYYAALFLTILLLKYLKLHGKDNNKSIKLFSLRGILSIVGIGLIVFGFASIFNWENPWIQYVTEGHFEGASSIFFGSEDAVSWTFVTEYLVPIGPLQWLEFKRILAFSILPFLEILLGTGFVTKIDIR